MGKTLRGVVVSEKGDKTIVVRIQNSKTHPIYHKQFFVSRNIMAHDEKNEAHEGDTVTITETKPVSARKRFALKKVVTTAGIEHVEPEPAVTVEEETKDE
ncbi:MAG: 30S ribosomal protein S17 [Candidatus Saccharibacteria bacterium]|nr:30S ribosomal protein S17 [Candidatus Saccharibacteria bacterium]